MSPGMPNAASEFCDRAGHIMNYGDGWYGGVYVAAMYSLSFVSDDIGFIVEEALKTIPEQSRYHRCMKDVIAWHKQYPGDWKRTWFECEKKWSSDIGCPDGVFVPFNIDAVTNSAYILIGLLYGEGDFSKTLDIATRCGQDSDCNPASAGGILGAMLGYSKIPEKWMRNLREVEDMEFAYTDISLNRTYKMSFDQALEVIRRNGGSAGETDVTIACQQPVPVRFEQSFEGHYPTERRAIHQSLPEAGVIEFDGIGAVLTGALRCPDESYVAEVTFSIDGLPVERVKLPALYRTRRHELFWRYRLPSGPHRITAEWHNPRKDASLLIRDLLVYDALCLSFKVIPWQSLFASSPCCAGAPGATPRNWRPARGAMNSSTGTMSSACCSSPCCRPSRWAVSGRRGAVSSQTLHRQTQATSSLHSWAA